MRLLLNPDPAPGGGGGTPPPTPPPATPPSPPAPPPVPTLISVTSEQYQAWMAKEVKLAEIEATHRRETDAKETERLQALAAKGQADEALTQLRTAKDTELKAANDRGNALESQILTGRKDATLADSLLGATFVSTDAASQVKTILDGRFEAVRDAAGVVTVREKVTGRAAAEVVKEWLASPAASHFLKADTQGGGGGGGGSTPAPTPGEGGAPASYADWKNQVLQVDSNRNELTSGLFGRPPRRN